MFGLGTWEIAVILIVALLIFGHRLPSVMRSLGAGVIEFKKGMRGVTDEVRSEIQAHDPIDAPPPAPQPAPGDTTPRAG